MTSSSIFHTDIKVDRDDDWQYDFRREIEAIYDQNYIPDIKEQLNRLVGREPDAPIRQSVDGLSNTIGPLVPQEYHVTNKQASTGTKATGLRKFLTDQIGRPRYEKFIQSNKKDLVELLVAFRALDEDIERPVNAVPTSLPSGAEQLIPNIASKRSQPAYHPDIDPDHFIKLTGEWESQVQPMVSESDFHVYEFDVTPPRDGEQEDILLLRRHAKAMERHGKTAENLKGIYRAGYHLNHDESVYYVGFANDVIDRLDRHLRGATGSGSTFPHLFKPTGGVINITGAETKDEARDLEADRAAALTKPGHSWAYYN